MQIHIGISVVSHIFKMLVDYLSRDFRRRTCPAKTAGIAIGRLHRILGRIEEHTRHQSGYTGRRGGYTISFSLSKGWPGLGAEIKTHYSILPPVSSLPRKTIPEICRNDHMRTSSCACYVSVRFFDDFLYALMLM
jgi:hypothetical protein